MQETWSFRKENDTPLKGSLFPLLVSQKKTVTSVTSLKFARLDLNNCGVEWWIYVTHVMVSLRFMLQSQIISRAGTPKSSTTIHISTYIGERRKFGCRQNSHTAQPLCHFGWGFNLGKVQNFQIWWEHVGVSKNSGKPPKMDGENHEKPYVQMDGLGGG